VGILKSLWARRPDGRWAATDLKGIYLNPKAGCEADYFTIDSEVVLMTTTPGPNIEQLFSSFGTTEFLLKQSIVPVVLWKDGDVAIRCLGTASIISCSGYLLTAAHVIMDIYDSQSGVVRVGDRLEQSEGYNFGVLIPVNPATGTRGVRFFPIEWFSVWGNWFESPLIAERDRFDYLTDIAICKIFELPNGAPHQPLNLSLNPFEPGETAWTLGYAEMADIPLRPREGQQGPPEPPMDIYVSVGEVKQLFPENHRLREVPTPGPCFDFMAKIPGKMSGAPIFGGDGAVIRGVVSRSFYNERHAFGAMLGPAMHLPLAGPWDEGRTLRTVMETGSEGMAIVRGMGL
jgi:hypothetical protein